MKSKFLALAIAMAPALAAPAFTAPASAQTRQEQYRWDQAQRRFDREQQIYQRERAIYEASRNRYRSGYYDRGYGPGYGSGYGYDERNYATDYDASRYYRDDPRYQERVLTSQDEVYRGSDGRYYCRRSDGTTGLIIGAGAGALLGNVIDGGRNRTAGTLIGGALGALLGRSVEQNANVDVRCR